MCMYICIYVCMYVCIYFIHLIVYVYMCLCVTSCVRMYAGMRVYRLAGINMYLCMHVRMNGLMSSCVGS